MTDRPASPESPFGEDLWDVLARYTSGESPVREAEAVRGWLAGDPRRAELVSSLERSIGRLSFAPPEDLDVEAALRRVHDRLSEPDVRPLLLRPARQWITVGLRAAAVVVLALGGALLWRSTSTSSGPRNIIAARTYSTPPGRSDSIRLADGSLAILGPGSELTVAAGYGQPERSASLQGVALFDVVHDEKRPFSVRAGVALIQDLGTTFGVRNDGEEDVRVVVTSGSVLLQGTEKSRQGTSKPSRPTTGGVVLRGGDRGSVDRDGRPTVEPKGASPDDLAWTNGRLLFDNASLGRVRADLRRWYGVDLKVADSSLANRHLTASFAGEPIDRVLDVIGLALGARIERQGNTAVLKTR